MYQHDNFLQTTQSNYNIVFLHFIIDFNVSTQMKRVCWYLVVVTDEDVNGRQEQLKHGLLVTLFHFKA